MECWWVFEIPGEPEYLSEALDGMLELNKEVFEITSGFVIPTRVEYSLRLYDEDVELNEKDFYDIDYLTTSREKLESKDEVDFEKIKESIYEYGGNGDEIKVVSNITIEESKTKILYDNTDEYLDRNSENYKKTSHDELCVDEPVRYDPLSIDISYSIDAPNKDEYGNVMYKIWIKTYTDIWFEDTEIGELNKRRLSRVLHEIYDTFKVEDLRMKWLDSGATEDEMHEMVNGYDLEELEGVFEEKPVTQPRELVELEKIDFPDEIEFERLVELTEHDDMEVVKKAYSELEKIDFPDEIEFERLVELTEHDDMEVVKKAYSYLSERDDKSDEVINLCVDRFDDPNPTIRAEALDTFAALTNPAFDFSKIDRNPSELLDIVGKQLKDDNPEVRGPAAQILEIFLSTDDDDFPDEPSEASLMVHRDNSELSEKARKAALMVYRDDENPEVRRRALLSVGTAARFGDTESAEALMTGFDDDAQKVREQASKIAGTFAHFTPLQPKSDEVQEIIRNGLIDRLDSQYSDTRRAAVGWIRMFEDLEDDVVEKVEDMADNDPSSEVREKAEEALEKLHEEE